MISTTSFIIGTCIFVPLFLLGVFMHLASLRPHLAEGFHEANYQLSTNCMDYLNNHLIPDIDSVQQKVFGDSDPKPSA